MKTRKLQRYKKGSLFNETGPPNQCQCGIECNRPALAKEAFCKAHINQCPRFSPMSGWEPEYDPKLWNSRMAFRETHNCFSYAMNVFDKKQVYKCKHTNNCNVGLHQPGYSSGYNGFTNSEPKTCPNMIARIFGDNPSIQMTDFATKCPAGYSKAAVIIDASDDYHFLRQDSSGYWSHKPGSNRVKNVDAFGHKICDPKLANYNYQQAKKGILNYDIFCSYLCVPRNRPLYLSSQRRATRRL